MSFITSTLQCQKCKYEMNVAFGIVGTQVIAEHPKECPKCKSTNLKKISDGWNANPTSPKDIIKEIRKDFIKNKDNLRKYPRLTKSDWDTASPQECLCHCHVIKGDANPHFDNFYENGTCIHCEKQEEHPDSRNYPAFPTKSEECKVCEDAPKGWEHHHCPDMKCAENLYYQKQEANCASTTSCPIHQCKNCLTVWTEPKQDQPAEWEEEFDLIYKDWLGEDYVVLKKDLKSFIRTLLSSQRHSYIKRVKEWTKGRNVTKDSLRHYLNDLLEEGMSR